MSVNERVKKVRESLNFTQKELADKLNVGQSTVADIEKGRIYPNPGYIEGLHDIFDINLNWLICGSGKMKEQKQSEAEDMLKSETLIKLMESQTDYGMKDKYIKVLEENAELKTKLAWYLENCDCAKTKQGSQKRA